MNWDAIGAIGEIGGALGVIFSLIYLAFQIKGETRARRADTTHSQSMAFVEIQQNVSTNPVLADIYVRGLDNYINLKPHERSQFSTFIGGVFRVFEDNYFQWMDGNLDKRLWSGMEAPVIDQIAYPGCQSWWKTRKHWYSEDFQIFVDSKIGDKAAKAIYPENGSEINT